jgi:hypothetical protein
MRNPAVAPRITDEVDLPRGLRVDRTSSLILAKTDQAKGDSKGRQLVQGRPILMVRHFLRSTERQKLHQRILSAKTVRTNRTPKNLGVQLATKVLGAYPQLSQISEVIFVRTCHGVFVPAFHAQPVFSRR